MVASASAIHITFYVQTEDSDFQHKILYCTWFRIYLSMPVSFFPSVFESVGRLFMDGVLKQDLSEHYQHREFYKTPAAERECEPLQNAVW